MAAFDGMTRHRAGLAPANPDAANLKPEVCASVLRLARPNNARKSGDKGENVFPQKAEHGGGPILPLQM
jgi:hypothetical protein